MNQPSLHLFDLDHTLIRSNSSFCFGKFLYHRGYFSFFNLCQLLVCYGAHAYLGLSLRDLHSYVFRKLLKGRSVAEAEQWVHCFLDEQLDHLICPLVMARLTEAQEKGEATFILSSSPQLLVNQIGRRWGVTRSYGSQYLSGAGDLLTSVGEVVDGAKKAHIVDELLEEFCVDRDQLAAYSDSLLDLPFLEKVGHPVGVSRKKGAPIEGVCRKRGWELLFAAHI